MKSEDRQISLSDPDARSMATSGKDTGIVGYNVQIAVDRQHHLIVAHEVTNVGSDRHQLASMWDVLVRDRLWKASLDDPGEARQERHTARRTAGALGGRYLVVPTPLLELRFCVHYYRKDANLRLRTRQAPARYGRLRRWMAIA